MKVAIEAWSEIVTDVIPFSRLNDAYLGAMRNRETNFAIGAPELVKAWKVISEAERYRPMTGADIEQMLRGDVCKDCHGTGTEIITEGDYTTSRVCLHLN